MKNSFLVSLVSAFFFTTTACNSPQEQQNLEAANFADLIRPTPRDSVLAEDGYFVWGGSVVRGDDNRYHMFYSRWPTEFGFDAWVTHSEIAHGISDDPSGPFHFVDVALPVRGAEFWDGLTTHNPTVHKFSGRYYLYYMGTTGDGVASDTLNFLHRNNQRIGVAVADSPSGPWRRFDTPVVDVSGDDEAYDALMTSNPSVALTSDNKILMIYKAVAKHDPLPFGGPVTHMVALADDPVGPFKKLKQLVFYKEGEHFAAEDPYIWRQESDNQYYALVKDMQGVFTGAGTSIAFFQSPDGLKWSPAAQPLASKIEVLWEDGQSEGLSRLERPQILLENGKPIILYAAAMRGHGPNALTMNIHIPLKKK